MSPRSTIAEARMTRDRIVTEAVRRASVDGLGQLTIGSLADALSMSKAGVVGPFGSKATLQSAVLERAIGMFVEAVVTPGMSRPEGLPRLLDVIDRWTNYLEESPFPNGCFVTAASCELDGRPGPLRDHLRSTLNRWRAYLRDQVVAAQAARDIPAAVDADDAVRLLMGHAMVANQEIQMFGEPNVARRTRRLMLVALEG